MLYFRSCPHCRTGTVQLDWDQEGRFLQCLNCGWMLDFRRSEAVARAPLELMAMGEAESDAALVESAPAA